jgi:hypothetical protein
MRMHATKPTREALSADERQRRLSQVYRLLIDLARENVNKGGKSPVAKQSSH